MWWCSRGIDLSFHDTINFTQLLQDIHDLFVCMRFYGEAKTSFSLAINRLSINGEEITLMTTKLSGNIKKQAFAVMGNEEEGHSKFRWQGLPDHRKQDGVRQMGSIIKVGTAFLMHD